MADGGSGGATSGSGVAAARRINALPIRMCCWLLLLRAVASLELGSAYWGNGWEDPSTLTFRFRGLPVALDDTSAASPAYSEVELDDTFDWRAFEANGGQTQVKGSEFFVEEPLRSWIPRTDAVRHGYFMLYRMDDLVSNFTYGNMTDHFFSISFDANVHPAYEAWQPPPAPPTPIGVLPETLELNINSSVRFTIWESPPADLTLPDTSLLMQNDPFAFPAHQEDIMAGNSIDVDTRRKRFTWGVELNEGGSLTKNCTRPVSQLYIGVQCLQGFAFPAGSCFTAPNAAPTLDDCFSYCPYTLTVRAIPKKLHAGDEVKTLMGPGQWQAFEVEAGPYDLFDVTIDRAEYDPANMGQYGDQVYKDGFSGRAWLSRDTCIKEANTTMMMHEGYCPHGGQLYVNENGEDVAPHRFCSRMENYSYQLNLNEASTWVRDVAVEPGLGELDDLGYSATLAQIAERKQALAQSMHYPTQLQIRAQIAALQGEAQKLSFTNSTWRRRWPMRLCTSAMDAGKYYLSIYADEALDAQGHSGVFIIRFTNTQFDRSILHDQTPRRGCLKRGGSESFYLNSSLLHPERTSLGLAEARGYYLNDTANHVSTMTVRRGLAPTSSLFDAQVSHPSLRVSMSACDVSAQQQWHFKVDLAPNAALEEVFFEIVVTLEDSTRSLGDSISGAACCGQYKYYAFPSVDERVAPSVDFNLTSGRVKALYWRYGSCPREDLHVVNGICKGWCVLDWYRLFSANLGNPQYITSSTLPVPYGVGEEPDKRRGGTWYLGVHALDEFATYSLTTSSRAPSVSTDGECDRLDRYCNMPNRYASGALFALTWPFGGNFTGAGFIKDGERSAAPARVAARSAASCAVLLACACSLVHLRLAAR